jgi:polygalacturonase
MKALLFAIALILSTQPLHAAATVAVGTCHGTTPHYPTIQQAVNAVSSGGTVLVCPGVYAEQVTITQSLTLKGVASGTAQAATIAPPPTA